MKVRLGACFMLLIVLLFTGKEYGAKALAEFAWEEKAKITVEPLNERNKPTV